jgi:hypothetical protein
MAITLEFPYDDVSYLIDFVEDMIHTHEVVLKGYIDDDTAEMRDEYLIYHSDCLKRYQSMMQHLKTIS